MRLISKFYQIFRKFLGRRFEMEVTRYSKERQRRVYNYSKSAGASDEQARTEVIKLKNFINNGALPHNK